MSEGEQYRNTYRFGPLERRGIAGALRPGQVLVLGASCVLAVAVFRRWPTGLGLGVALASVASACTISWLPLAGRNLDEWVPVLARWTALRVVRQQRHISPAPSAGFQIDLAEGALRRPDPLPPALNDTELAAIPTD